MDISITGRRPILRYSGTSTNEPELVSQCFPDITWDLNIPKPNARFGYETRSDAFVGVMPNSSAYKPMYTDGPRSAQLPRKLYREQTSKIIDFFQAGHYQCEFEYTH
jgi:hypothetical protein